MRSRFGFYSEVRASPKARRSLIPANNVESFRHTGMTRMKPKLLAVDRVLPVPVFKAIKSGGDARSRLEKAPGTLTSPALTSLAPSTSLTGSGTNEMLMQVAELRIWAEA